MGLFLASAALLALLLVLPVPLRLGNFELAAYVRAEADPAAPRQGATYLTATGFRGEKSAELILRLRNGSLRLAWVITP